MAEIGARLEHVWEVGAVLGECPTWLPGEDALAWVDGLALSCNRLDLGSGRDHRVGMPAKIGSAAPFAGGGAIVALAGGLARLGADDRLTPLSSPVSDGIVFNDGKCDSAGRFWIGSRSADGSDGGGALFRVDADLSVTRVRAGFDVCNGMGWSPDGRRFYLSDTVPRTIHAYAFDPGTGTIDQGTVLHRFDGSRGKPDGMAVDALGRLWCAMWDGGGIAVIEADGTTAGWVDVAVPRPTSCAFGGADLRTLFVTTASYGVPPGDRSGGIFQYRVDVPGAPVALMAVT